MPEPKPVSLDWARKTLRKRYGPPEWPAGTDPFHQILYQQVGYLVPKATRQAAFARLEKEVGLAPDEIRKAPLGTLRAIARAGGTIAAAERAGRMRQSAELVERRYAGDLRAALDVPLPKARRALQAFPMIGAPGADRILAASGAHAVLGLESNGLRVAHRLGFGSDRGSYAAAYRSAQAALADQLPKQPAALAEISALFEEHGATLCRRTGPHCDECPLASRCPSASDFLAST